MNVDAQPSAESLSRRVHHGLDGVGAADDAHRRTGKRTLDGGLDRAVPFSQRGHASRHSRRVIGFEIGDGDMPKRKGKGRDESQNERADGDFPSHHPRFRMPVGAIHARSFSSL